MRPSASESEKNSKRGLIIILIVLVAVIGIAAIAYGFLGSSANNAVSESQLEPAASFTMTTADNKTVTLDELKGKPIVLNFWSSNCGPCRSEMPELQSAYEKYGDRINFVMVDIIGFNGETKADAESFIARMGYSFPIYFDSNRDASKTYGLNSVPRSYFITASGNVSMEVLGAMDKATLDEGIDRILG